ncbi:MAG: 4-(cytidine 5'-diphospho)-2-C-methyl-D-erythritol kinase [Firmicutes bacterium]|nr:4-(cytidine 5'-diphospho)-2-C-methyl-D-erythritol kinase [Bacillota bacterium]
MSIMALAAHGKINLALDVLGRREDGYHEVEMVMHNIALHDMVYLEETPGLEITLHCPQLDIPPKENLAYRAALLLQREGGVRKGAAISIDKKIPAAAGLAGGSSDAAAVLRGLNCLWDVGFSRRELMELGQVLGADIPYCIHGGACLARGIGEILTPLPPLPRLPIILAKPPGGLATAAIYGGLDLANLRYRPHIPGLVAALEEGSLEGVAANLGNVLQGVSEGLIPLIGKLQRKMLTLGAVGSMMTGSGPTIFGLFPEGEKVDATAKKLEQCFPKTDIIVTESIVPVY